MHRVSNCYVAAIAERAMFHLDPMIYCATREVNLSHEALILSAWNWIIVFPPCTQRASGGNDAIGILCRIKRPKNDFQITEAWMQLANITWWSAFVQMGFDFQNAISVNHLFSILFCD